MSSFLKSSFLKNLRFHALLCFTVTLWSAGAVRGDIVVSTINFLAQTPQEGAGLLRFDEVTGTHLSAGDIPPFASMAGPFGPTDVTVGPNGNIFVADGFTGSILHFDGRIGAPLPSPIGGPAGLYTGVAVSGNLTFTSLAFGGDGRLYAADADLGAIRVYDGPGGALPGMQVDTLLDNPSSPIANLASLAFDQSGKLLVSDRDGGQVFRVDVATDDDEVIISGSPSGGFFTPVGMAVGASGDIFVANLFGSNLLKFDPNGENGVVFADVPLVEGDVDGGSFPADIVFDRNGDLLVGVLGGNNQIGSGEGRILRFDAAGVLQQTLADKLDPVSGIVLIDDLVPGDFNGDGLVDQQDYAEWTAQFAESVTPTHGADGNGDGLVDAADYTIWRDTLEATGIATEASLAASQVPEPHALAIIGFGLLALLAHKLPLASSRFRD